MLDIEELVPPTVGLDEVVTLAELKSHLRIQSSVTRLDDELTASLKAAVEYFDAPRGPLNRSIRPRTWKRYLRNFPSGTTAADRIIKLPYAPLIRVDEITVEDGESPTTIVSPANYVVKKTLMPEIELRAGKQWPTVTEGPRAVSITYQAGYEDGYPEDLKRLIKIMAAHFHENPEATINEPRVIMINRRVDYAYEYLLSRLKISNSYEDWDG